MSFASGSSQPAIGDRNGSGYGYQLTSIAEVQGSATGNKIYSFSHEPACSPPWQTRCGATLMAVDVAIPCCSMSNATAPLIGPALRGTAPSRNRPWATRPSAL